MNKLILSLVAVFAGLCMITADASAQQDFFIEAEVPAADGATFTVSKVIPPDNFQPPEADGFNALDFSVLTLDTANGIFVPAFFWVIDVGSNGAGFPDVQFSYGDTNNPNGALDNGDGLGGRGTIAYSEIVTNPDGSQTDNLIRGEALQDTNTSGGIDETDYANGFLRLAVGIATGDPTLQEGTALPFTAADNPGIYSGTLIVTATFD